MSLPPLNAARAFEAVGRLGSVKLGAQELFVTPGAISRQLAMLEDFLGVPLFVRSHRRVTLTDSGKKYFDRVSEALLQLRDATEEIKVSKGRDRLRIWCPMTFGMRWLVPRLPAFREKHPERDLVFTTSLGPIEFGSHATDVAIRIGRGDWPGCSAHRLSEIKLTPVCSPSLLQSHAPWRSAHDLAKVTLLQSAARPNYWHLWLSRAGVPEVDAERGITFESVSLAYQMAIDGAGVAMGQLALVGEDIAAGRLVTPFSLRVDSGDAFYLIYPTRLDSDPFVASLRDWLLAEAEADFAEGK